MGERRVLCLRLLPTWEEEVVVEEEVEVEVVLG